MTSRQRLHDDESGITLVELIIYMSLAAVFLLLVSAIFINGWQSQTATADRDRATGSANAVSASLQQSARNAVALRTVGDHTLVATVVTSATTIQCRAWRVSGDALQYTTSDSAPLDLDGEWTTLADVESATFAPAAPAVEDVPTKSVDYTIRFQESVTIAGGLAPQGQVDGDPAGVTC
ncbi:hypothetical protein Q9R19_10385 [Microbacterium sp. ARD32]|uniref:pilus assembly FimT family protein n=1 Tax=Microbacterium sp. ARD32 TaxID=2962577 RepID=UPI0028815B35|nr:hypothetical protein [Microbacterium sp. ARD32]MDT0158030.1 hypothetical protein [Microbacterium sp. ARD32]